MPNVTSINWQSAEARLTDDAASMQVDYDDNTQSHFTADSDVTAESAFVQAVHAALFPSGD